MSIWTSINCPTVIRLPTVCYSSREKPPVKPTAPGSSFSYICFAIYFMCTFYSDSLKQKYKNTLLHFILFAICYFNPLQLSPIRLPILRRRTPEGIDNPFNTSGCELLFFVCRGFLRCVAWFSYWFDNLGFITDGNTYRRCAASSLPLWGNTNVASSNIKRNFWCHCGEDLQHIPGS